MASKKTASSYGSPLTGTEGMYDLDEQTNLALFLLDHIEGQLNRADTKAQLTLTADAFLVAVISRTGEGVFLSILDAGTPFLWRVEGLVRVLTIASLFASVYFAFTAIIPVLTGPKSKLRNLYYFGSIALMESKEFIKQFIVQKETQAREIILDEVHLLSGIASQKFSQLRMSHIFLVIALAFWLVNQLLLAILPAG